MSIHEKKILRNIELNIEMLNDLKELIIYDDVEGIYGFMESDDFLKLENTTVVRLVNYLITTERENQ